MGRSEELAEEIESRHAAFADYLAGLSEEQWKAPAANCPDVYIGQDEHRPVGVVAHHVGDNLSLIAERAFMLASGQPLQPLSGDDFDAANERHAAVNPNPDQAETIAMIRDAAGRAAELIRGMSDEQLDRPGSDAMSSWTAEKMIRRVLLGHVEMHESSIRASV